MRFHHLTVTAFGPYAGTEVVDFEELNDAGVFLLTGPTGAGKTSILDAICFALYGVVPGERGVKALRSHHAAPGVRPQVVLEATIGSRRFRIRRSPEWRRPKKRGEGETKENASASLIELSDGGERLVSDRIQEVGHELGLLLAMTSEQFMQVVMLPQGEFQTFLRASSDERQEVLQRLFATQRFSRIEEWMRDRTRELCTLAAIHEKRVAQLLGTIADRSAAELPASLASDPLGEVAPQARSWSRSLVDKARKDHEDAVARERFALELLAKAEARDREAAREATALERRRGAELALAELDATESACAADGKALARHGRAVLVRPLVQPLVETEATLERVSIRRDRALRRLEELPAALRPESADCDGCVSAHARLADRMAMLRALQPREKALAADRAALDAAQRDLAELRELLETTAARAEQLPEERREVVARMASARLAAAGLDAARATLETTLAQHDAVSLLPAKRAEHAEVLERSQAARDCAAEARERHLDVVERRLAGMAAELAGQLVEGAPCQVCGSAAHPQPAAPSSDAVTQEHQQAAQTEYERLRLAAEELASRAEESSRSLQQLEARSGGLSPSEVAAHLAAQRAAVAQADAAAALLPGLVAEAADLDAEERRITALLRSTHSRIGAREAEVAGLQSTIGALSEELSEALAGHRGSLSEVIGDHESAVAVLEEVVEALRCYERADEACTQARARADQAAKEQGFLSSAEARSALLEPATVEKLEQDTRERAARRQAALAVLADKEILRLRGGAGADLGEVRTDLEDAKETSRRCATEVGRVERASAALAALAVQLDTALTEWEPLRAEHQTAERISKLVRGMGSDNQLQMRLSSYVLATRLDQVLEAANHRLAQMRDQRYALRRTGRARGGSRAGLGLEVQDGWTGEVRDPCTLSGGETFVVSLALALGLADVVIQESGGLRVDTLFIDEGFGMLDPDTLDDVMDRIDALRAGGRTVGVVSHVSELRGRIPTQLHISRGRSGSTVAVRTLVT